MKVYRGKSIFQGVAIGKISLYKKERHQVIHYKIADRTAEVARFVKAQETAICQLTSLYKKALSEIGESGAEIFEVYQMLLQDPDYVNSVKNIIITQTVNAEYAVIQTSDTFSAMFAAMEDEYMQERASDIKNVSDRVLRVLSENDGRIMEAPSGYTCMPKNQGEGLEAPSGYTCMPKNQGEALETPSGYTCMPKNQGGVLETPEASIIVAEDFAPGEIIQMDKEKIKSLVMVHGSANSHTAILARTMGIPSIAGVDLVLEEELDGKFAIVDGNNGCLYIEPEEGILVNMKKKLQEEAESRSLLQIYKNKKSRTLDGKTVMLSANIGNLHDLTAALQNGAEGIGLFRSEFLYLQKNTYPTEEEQFQMYRSVAEAMADKRTIIRTLDIGADKKIGYFGLDEEENPAMGLRAIRVCLKHPRIFRAQLRAILRASAFGKVGIMYPMITSVEEVVQIRQIVEEVKKDLQKEDISYGEFEQGIMIETPAAAIISDLLAEHVDFFSIGTNDLSQYTLAADRQNPLLEPFFKAYHPAVLRTIYQTVQNAHQAGIWCGICGELGSDKELTKLFLQMGVDELSVPPGNILPLRELICQADIQKEESMICKMWENVFHETC